MQQTRHAAGGRSSRQRIDVNVNALAYHNHRTRNSCILFRGLRYTFLSILDLLLTIPNVRSRINCFFLSWMPMHFFSINTCFSSLTWPTFLVPVSRHFNFHYLLVIGAGQQFTSFGLRFRGMGLGCVHTLNRQHRQAAQKNTGEYSETTRLPSSALVLVPRTGGPMS
jgi:hypothetical protein